MGDPICICGHPRSAHIYHEGACRTGKVLCPCAEFQSTKQMPQTEVTVKIVVPVPHTEGASIPPEVVNYMRENITGNWYISSTRGVDG